MRMVSYLRRACPSPRERGEGCETWARQRTSRSWMRGAASIPLTQLRPALTAFVRTAYPSPRRRGEGTVIGAAP